MQLKTIVIAQNPSPALRPVVVQHLFGEDPETTLSHQC